jgi:hypothetical protein
MEPATRIHPSALTGPIVRAGLYQDMRLSGERKKSASWPVAARRKRQEKRAFAGFREGPVCCVWPIMVKDLAMRAIEARVTRFCGWSRSRGER